MLFVLFQLGKDRYALEASRVVEVVPLLEMKQLPQAPKGVAGVFNYRGQPVPAVDLSELTLGQRASERFSTRIIIINYPDDTGTNRLLGLIAEYVTETLRKDPKDFVDSGVKLGQAPYLGPILMEDPNPVQWIYEQRLLPESVRDVLLSEHALMAHDGN
jgi:chemotaxis-related protein WspB